ncbi:MAG TPA: hypothetical protein VGR57_03375 [Ktedonobacterales bacterium]|nr:hypothetical protein [Ktedonobacterales bacterium]
MATRPPPHGADALEIVLGDLDDRDDRGGARGQAILADGGVGVGVGPDWSWLAQLRGRGRVPFAGVIVLLVALLLGVTPSARDGTALVVDVGAGARLALSGMAQAIYVEPSVPWATVTLDGRRLPHIPQYGGASALYLTPGTHKLVWRAAPFDSMPCTLSQPTSPSDTCARAEVVNGDTPGVIATDVFFKPSLTTLSAQQRGALVTTIQRALDAQTASETVQPGERYVGVDGSLPPELWGQEPVATAPLAATLRLRLVSDYSGAQTCHIEYSESCEQGGQDCRFLCSLAGSPYGDAWQALAIVRGLWTFATPGGKSVVSDAPDGLAGAGTAVHLRLKWSGSAWQVALTYFSPSLPAPGHSLPPAQLGGYPGCTWLQTALDTGEFDQHAGSAGPTLTWRVAAGPPGAVGCLAIGASAGIAPPQGAYLLQRFGVILAANDLAHQRWPYLPLAGSYARQLATMIATTQFPHA